MTSDRSKFTSITILLPAGRLTLDMQQKIQDIARTNNLELYLTIQQNLRLLNVPEAEKKTIMDELSEVGATFKAPDIFPIPRVCVGKPHCNLGIIDTKELSQKILNTYRGRKMTKPKLKIGISACSLSCSGSRTSDIGIVAKKSGYDVYAGGKSGPNPVVGRRVSRSMTEEAVLEIVEQLVTFHDLNTKKIQRMHRLLDHPDFPFR